MTTGQGVAIRPPGRCHSRVVWALGRVEPRHTGPFAANSGRARVGREGGDSTLSQRSARLVPSAAAALPSPPLGQAVSTLTWALVRCTAGVDHLCAQTCRSSSPTTKSNIVSERGGTFKTRRVVGPSGMVAKFARQRHDLASAQTDLAHNLHNAIPLVSRKLKMSTCTQDQENLPVWGPSWMAWNGSRTVAQLRTPVGAIWL